MSDLSLSSVICDVYRRSYILFVGITVQQIHGLQCGLR